MSRYADRVKKLKLLQASLIIICVLGIAFFFYYLLKPKVVEYPLKDECGPIGGAISHSIDDEDTCGNACSAYCQSTGKSYHDSKFTMIPEACNQCTCQCEY